MQFSDYSLSDYDFKRLCSLIRHHTAIELSDSKRALVFSRFSRRLRSLGLRSFGQYCDLVESGDETEICAMTTTITTNFTRFFREEHHFEFLQQSLERHAESRCLRIWSAGCATGEEPYSIAMTLLGSLPDIADWDIRILATDIDKNALRFAADGVFSEDRITGIDPAVCKRWFLRGKGRFEKRVRIVPEVQELISFRELNLIREWPMRKHFDIIFCRNVMIYFGQDFKRTLIERFSDLQRSGDLLFIDHSENLSNISEAYSPVERTVYERICEA